MIGGVARRVGVLALGAQAPTDPAFRIRVLLPKPVLGDAGVAVEPLPLLTTAEARLLATGARRARVRVVLNARRRLASELNRCDRDADVALVQRQVDLLPVRRLESAAGRGRRLILDVDDAIWLDTSRESGAGPLAVLKGTRRKLRWLAACADHVIAGNDYIAERLGSHADRVTVVPSLVDPSAVAPRMHAEREGLVLGWIGSRSTAGYLDRLRGPLSRFARQLPRTCMELATVGGEPPPVPGIRITSAPWSEDAERALLERMDIGLMPQPDNSWTRGKCAYKALQYMSAAVPVVADAVGVTGDVVGRGPAGVIVHTDEEWIEALTALAADPGLRQRLGDRGRRRTEDDFSLTRWAPALATIIRGDS
jgi:glycosyltransferase involved in cell wall biosynthesis